MTDPFTLLKLAGALALVLIAYSCDTPLTEDVDKAGHWLKCGALKVVTLGQKQCEPKPDAQAVIAP